MNTNALDQNIPHIASFMENRTNHVNLRRLFAATADLIFWFLTLTIPNYFLGDELYKQNVYIWVPLTFFLYFAVPEGRTGYTLGKWIFRARVLNEEGQIPGIKAGVIRSIFRIFEGVVFFLPAAFFALSSKHNQRLGDFFAGTYVMSSKNAETFLPSKEIT